MSKAFGIICGLFLIGVGAACIISGFLGAGYWFILMMGVILILSAFGGLGGDDSDRIACPECDEPISPRARKCKHCHSEIKPRRRRTRQA